MFIELVDALRCPNAHEESWLVLSASRLEARHVRDGTLGCPVCRAEYPIRDGIADFRVSDASDAGTAPESDPSDDVASHVGAEQLAAMLNLSDALGFAVLAGGWARHADALHVLVDGPPLLLVDPPLEVVMGPGVSGIRCDARLPLALGAARAVAVDGSDPRRVSSAAESTRVGGRVVAPVTAPVPAGVRELARDAAVWVAARETVASGLITLHVRRGQ